MDNPIIVIDNILDLAPIQPGKLGHATVVKSPDVRVVVLSFAAGHVLKEHSAPLTLLMQALDGHLKVTAGGQTIDLVPGGLIRMDASERHQVEGVVDSRLMLTLIG